MKTTPLLIITLVVLLALIPSVTAASGIPLLLGGATYTVTKTADTADGACDSDCSLREAIIAADANPGADTISVPAGTYNLTRYYGEAPGAYDPTQGDLEIWDSVTIVGAGPGSTIIDGLNQDRVFFVVSESGINVRMEGLTIQHGSTDNGAGINNNGNLTLTNVVLAHNTATEGGGGIMNAWGAVTVVNSTISDNSALEGGGIYNNADHTFSISSSTITRNTADNNGGGISNAGTLSMSGSMLSANASGPGGGIYNEGNATISNSTITGNSSYDLTNGSGIYNAGTLSLVNSTVAKNTGSGQTAHIAHAGNLLTIRNSTITETPTRGVWQLSGTVQLQNTILNSSCAGTVTSIGNNLVPTGVGCSMTLLPSDLTGDPGLGGFNGTYAPLLASSQAIDNGNPAACSATDQIGNPRRDGDGDGTVVCDIGASEYQPPTPKTYDVTKTADTNDGACTPADCSLREATVAANANLGKDTINVPAGSYLLTIAGSNEDQAATGDLDLTEEVIVKGAGSAQTIVDGNELDNVFDAKKAVEFRGLTIRKGKPRGIQHPGATLIDVLVSNNPEGACCGSITGGTFLNNLTGIFSCDVRGVTVRQNELGIGCAVDPAHLTVRDSTASSNTAGIALYGTNVGSVNLVNVTLAQNAEGINAEVDGGTATADILNSTIVDNQTDFVFDGPLPNPRNSIVGSSGAWGLAPFNGRYFDLLPNSPALDTGDNGICPPTDQIGTTRPQDGNGDGSVVCDLGAIEHQYQAPSGPVLHVPSGVSGAKDIPVGVPVYFAANGRNIAAVTFSIDFDQACLTVDRDSSGLPDNIAFSVPGDFTATASYNAADTDGELDFLITDISPPLSGLPSGALVTITFTPTCQPQPGSTQPARVGFSSDPAASFGNTSGQSVAGATVDGSIEIQAVNPGDGNGDGAVNAGDISAIVLEIFDGDGANPGNAGGGTFAGTSGCDANRDGKIDAADISCTVLIIFGQPCGSASQHGASLGAQRTVATPMLAVPARVPILPGSRVTVPVSFTSHAGSIASVVFSLDYDERWLSLDPTDANSDGVPDVVHFTFPVGFTAVAALDEADTDGELDIAVADLLPPLTSLPDGVLAEVTLTVGEPSGVTDAFVKFSHEPPASFGSTVGQSVAGSTSDGVVAIVSPDLYMPLFLRQ